MSMYYKSFRSFAFSGKTFINSSIICYFVIFLTPSLLGTLLGLAGLAPALYISYNKSSLFIF